MTLTIHARKRMIERGITEKEIWSCLEKGQMVIDGSTIYYKNSYLVVAIEEGIIKTVLYKATFHKKFAQFKENRWFRSETEAIRKFKEIYYKEAII